MCEYCEGDIFTPIYESKDKDGQCEIGICYDNEGYYIEFLHETIELDVETLLVFPRINYCPMCGRKLAERGQ